MNVSLEKVRTYGKRYPGEVISITLEKYNSLRSSMEDVTLKIAESSNDNGNFYTVEIQEQVAATFQLATVIEEIRRLLTRIKEKAARLDTILLTEEEQAEYQNEAKAFDIKMQNMMCATFHNLETYQTQGWKELLYSEEKRDE